MSQTEDQKSIDWLAVAKALLYLLTGFSVIAAPWFLLYMEYQLLQQDRSIPMFEQLMYFCGVCIIGILGITPQVLDSLAKHAAKGLQTDTDEEDKT